MWIWILIDNILWWHYRKCKSLTMKKKWFHNLKKNKNRSLLFERECTCNLTNICLTYSNYIGNVDWLCVIFSAHYRCCSLICFWSCVSLVRCYIQLPVRTYRHSSAPSFLSVKEQQQNQFPCLSPPVCVIVHSAVCVAHQEGRWVYTLLPWCFLCMHWSLS